MSKLQQRQGPQKSCGGSTKSKKKMDHSKWHLLRRAFSVYSNIFNFHFYDFFRKIATQWTTTTSVMALTAPSRPREEGVPRSTEVAETCTQGDTSSSLYAGNMKMASCRQREETWSLLLRGASTYDVCTGWRGGDTQKNMLPGRLREFNLKCRQRGRAFTIPKNCRRHICMIRSTVPLSTIARSLRNVGWKTLSLTATWKI